ncbi:MAG: hypothetical protein RLZZ292_1825 [Bacteroidota bacterium]|jgi:hypothetical protein
MKKILAFSLSTLFFAACSTPTTKTPPTPSKEDVATPMVGGDQDEHGCKPSAGYTWSSVKNECIRIFESGVRLDPQAPELDKTLSAFVVFKSDTDDTQAELFIPAVKNSVLLAKVKKEGDATWKNDAYTLMQSKGIYTISDAKNKVLYQGSAAKN